MIELTQGDILRADAEALVNTVNCVGVMGRVTDRLKSGLTEKQLKRYRVARRRIRSHFGSAGAISQVAVTVGSRTTRRGFLCGFVFQVAGNS